MSVIELAQYGAIQVATDHWVKMNPEQRKIILKGLAKLIPETYSGFEEEHFNHLARQAHPDTLPPIVQGLLLMSVTANGFSTEQVMTVIEDAAKPRQG